MLKVMGNAEGRRRRIAPGHPLKLTSLLYLKEALLKERYEECPAIISLAKEYGASENQIRYLLEDPRRSPS